MPRTDRIIMKYTALALYR